MEQVTQTFDYLVFDSINDLPQEDLALLGEARKAVSGSYAPYSRYHVGAAVRMANGRVFCGSNQENMSFPAGLCAERVAVFAAAASCPGVPLAAIAITAVADDFEVASPVTPCGMCRQAIMEYEMRDNQKIRIILAGHAGRIFVFSDMGSLLPLAFAEQSLANLKTQKPK